MDNSEFCFYVGTHTARNRDRIQVFNILPVEHVRVAGKPQVGFISRAFVENMHGVKFPERYQAFSSQPATTDIKHTADMREVF